MFRQTYFARSPVAEHRSNWPYSSQQLWYYTEPDLLVIKHVLLNNPYVVDYFSINTVVFQLPALPIRGYIYTQSLIII
jgi:hypothetical protein